MSMHASAIHYAQLIYFPVFGTRSGTVTITTTTDQLVQIDGLAIDRA
jgi:hypothetical protein